MSVKSMKMNQFIDEFELIEQRMERHERSDICFVFSLKEEEEAIKRISFFCGALRELPH